MLEVGGGSWIPGTHNTPRYQGALVLACQSQETTGIPPNVAVLNRGNQDWPTRHGTVRNWRTWGSRGKEGLKSSSKSGALARELHSGSTSGTVHEKAGSINSPLPAACHLPAGEHCPGHSLAILSFFLCIGNFHICIVYCSELLPGIPKVDWSFFFFCLADLCLSTSSIAQSRDLLPNPHEFRPRRWSGLSICNEYSVCHSAGVDGADRVQPSPHRSIMTCAHEWGGEGRNLRYVRDARPFRIRFWLRCSEGEALGNPRQFRGARQFGTCPGRFRTKLLEPGELQTGAGWCTGHHGDLGRNGGGGTWNHPTAKFRGGSAPADKVDLAC